MHLRSVGEGQRPSQAVTRLRARRAAGRGVRSNAGLGIGLAESDWRSLLWGVADVGKRAKNGALSLECSRRHFVHDSSGPTEGGFA